MSIQYQISAHDVGAHIFAVELQIANPNPDGQILQLPTWIPGSYLIREFARHIVQISAFNSDGPVAVNKLNKSTWQLAPSAQPLVVQYEVYAFDLSVRGAYLDQTRAFFNGTSVFLAVQGQENLPCQLALKAGQFSSVANARVATGLQPEQVDANGFGTYLAADYDELIDCPVEVSDFALVEFEACGVPHRMAISGRHNTDLPRLADDLKRICEYQIRLFGEPAPFDQYLFMTMAVGDGYGGLEHRNSTALICNRSDLPIAVDATLSKGYRQFLGLCSHEYFHSWNVKRIKPAAYAPYDLQRENYTSLLWAFEGITSYYDDLTLLRTGLISLDDYLELLGQTATNVYRGYGRKRQSLHDSSIDTWVKYYRQDENSPNELVSYYTKGALVALCLDLHIRLNTQQQKSLDDVMRALWDQYGRAFAEQGQGLSEHQWEQLAAQVTGLDLADFFARCIRSTAELPLAQLLNQFGIAMQLRPAAGASDKGGWQTDNAKTPLSWGMRYTADSAGLKVTHVLRGQAACCAGLAAGDTVIAIDGIKASPALLDGLLAATNQPRVHQLHVFRRDELMQLAIQSLAAQADTVGFRRKETISQDESKLLESLVSY
jgi:predicted metalloprotease with PDZ domain